MKYKHPKPGTVSVAAPDASGVNIDQSPPPATAAFYPWQPSTWPLAPKKVDANFIFTLEKIFKESILGEIENVIEDARKSNGDLQHRGHVVAIALMCALDAISSYGYRKHNVAKFVKAHFPAEYRSHADALYKLYRNSMIHSWNLFRATILPGNEKITKARGTLSFGLLDFFAALQSGVKDFLVRLRTDKHLQTNSLNRYRKLKKSARS
jgi:hypothetical protein